MTGAILLQVILIFFNATFASAEIAVISMNETKLKQLASEGDVRAVRLHALTEQPARFLATIQVAITMASLLGSAYAADNFAGVLVEALQKMGVTVPENILKSGAVFVITLILAHFSLVFGELVPKRIAMKKADALALGMSGMLSFVAKMFAPLVWFLTISTNAVLRIMRINPNEEDDAVTEEEIRLLLLEGNEKGVIKKEESDIIQNVFEFDDLSVEQICTHRKDIVALSEKDDIGKWEETISSNRHTYYLVCGEEQDDIIGVLDTKDYFRLSERTKKNIMEKAVDKAVCIPETMKANTLFRKMKQTRQYFAVVIDEYGGLSGIVTLHDLMEALVGDLDDTDEPIRPKDIEKLGDASFRIQGCADLEEVRRELGVKLASEDCDTFNGYICSITGRIPDDEEQFSFETEELRIEVRKVEGHVIRETLVQLLES